MTCDFKLSNVVLNVQKHASEHPEIYYRVNAGAASYDAETRALNIKGSVDFLTYVNGCSACKWRQYAGIETVYLHVEVEGAGRIVVRGVLSDTDDIDLRIVAQKHFEGEGAQTLDLMIDTSKLDLVGFSIIADGAGSVSLKRAYYYAKVEKSATNHVELALSTTTFNNEQYILPNIELVKEGIAAEDGPVRDHFHMFVVDNGRSLDAEALTCSMVTVLPNPNTGGSGGFARGMLAATAEPGRFTHILLMDDDVSIMPESLIRTFNLLSLAQGKYKGAFINGAMLSLEEPTRMYEDVSVVLGRACYRKIKDDLDIDKLEDLVESERTNVELPNAYGAWWYSCIPLTAVAENGLPMPFFIRCDDVEFGMRNQPTYMTMNGISVWHASFEGRFRASVDIYQYVRNFLAMIALDDCCSDKLFVARMRYEIRQYLRELDYATAEFYLDGLEDYLKGPEFLENLDGAALMKKNGARNEKLVPVRELDPNILREAGVTEKVLANKSLEYAYRTGMKYVRMLPYDKHYLPERLLKGKASFAVTNNRAVLDGTLSRAKTIVYLDPTRQKGAVRHMDRERFEAIRKRERELVHRFAKEGKRVRRAWKAAKPYLSSKEFWEKYLGISE